MDSKLKSKVIVLLRGASRWWPEKNEAKKLARIDRGLYQCNICKGTFGTKEVVADHISPVVDPYKGWESFDIFIERLFCSREQYQILCQQCHDSKTAVEREIRKLVREQNKPKKEKKHGKAKRTNKTNERKRNSSTDSPGPT